MQLQCGQCGQVFAGQAAAGKRTVCPRCKRDISAPAEVADGQELVRMLRTGDAVEEGFAALARKVIARRVRIACQACGQQLWLALRRSGQVVRCPGCGAGVQVPDLGSRHEAELQRVLDRSAARAAAEGGSPQPPAKSAPAPVEPPPPQPPVAPAPVDLPPVDLPPQDPWAERPEQDAVAELAEAASALDVARAAAGAARPLPRRRRERRSVPLAAIIVIVLGIAAIAVLVWYFATRPDETALHQPAPQPSGQAGAAPRQTPEWDAPVVVPGAAGQQQAPISDAQADTPGRVIIAPPPEQRGDDWRLFRQP